MSGTCVLCNTYLYKLQTNLLNCCKSMVYKWLNFKGRALLARNVSCLMFKRRAFIKK